MTSTLVSFLRARYNEARQREHLKRRCIPSPFDGRNIEFRYSHGAQEELLVDGRPYPVDRYDAIATEPAPDLEIVADLDSKLAILTEYEQASKFYADNPGAPAGEAHGLWTAIRILARPHAQHPDFEEGWRL